MSAFIRFIIAFCLVLSLAVWALIHSPYVQEPLKAWASEVAQIHTGLPLSIEKVTFSLPAKLTIHKPVLGITDHPEISAEKVTITFSPFDLADGHYIPKRMIVQEGTLHRFEKLSILDVDAEISQVGSRIEAQLLFYPSELSSFPIDYQISSTLVLEEGKPLVLDDIHAELLGVSATGALAIGAGHSVDGLLFLVSQDLSPLGKWLKSPLKGQLDGSIAFSSDSEPPIILSLEGKNLESDSTSCSLCQLKGSLIAFSEKLPIDLLFSARDLKWNALTLENLSIVTQSHPDKSGNDYQVEAKGFAGQDLPLEASMHGTWIVDKDPFNLYINIQAIDGFVTDIPYHLVHPATITGTLDHLSLSEFVLSIAHSTLAIDLNLHDHLKAVNGHIKTTSELSEILQLFPEPPTLSGNIEGEFLISGTTKSPDLKGTCQVKDGSFALHKLGIILHNLSGTVTLDNRKATLVEARANDGSKGTVSATGFALLESDNNLAFELNIDLAQTIILDQDYAKAAVNGALTFAGDLTSARLFGKGTCTDGKITIADKAKSVVDHVEVTYVNHPEGAAVPQAQAITQAGTSWPINFDLSVDFPKNLKIVGTDLSSTWKGELAIKGNQASPLLIGEIKLVEGKYSFNGNPLVLKEGTISLNGDIEKKTNLYIIATRDLDEVDIDIILKGPVKNPSISFRSNPPMPQREILSWLLFNTGTSEISPFQGSQLTESITNLNTNTSQGPDVLTKIRSKLGIDRLEIGRCGTGADSQVSVKVGKYITDNLLICVNKREVNSVAIEAAISKKFKLQAQVSDDAQGQLMLKWKKDY